MKKTDAEIHRDAERYEYVRTLTPRAFWELYEIALLGRRTFDEIVDDRVARRKGKRHGSTEGPPAATQTL